MSNWDTSIMREYHQRSKLYPGDPGIEPRRVDPAIIPRPYKEYDRPLPEIPLPLDPPAGPSLHTYEALIDFASSIYSPLDVTKLATLLRYSLGVLRRTNVRGRDVEFRAASCTGALYHIEGYVVCADMPGLTAGVYHYDPRRHVLQQLREGDFREVLRGWHEFKDYGAHAYVVLTSTFYRNAWRYEDRSYRHAFWDAGTVIANAQAISAAHMLGASVRINFVDAEVNALVGVDGVQEAALALMRISNLPPRMPAPLEVTPLAVTETPLARTVLEFPAIERAHQGSAFADAGEGAEEVMHTSQPAQWKAEQDRGANPSDEPDILIPEEDPDGDPHPYGPWLAPAAATTLEEAIERRGSARHFDSQPLARDLAQAVLEAGIWPALPFDNGIAEYLEPYVLLNGVEGLAPGVYTYPHLDRSPAPASRPPTDALTPIRRGDFREQAAHLALDQAAAGEAAVNLYFMCDLDAVLERFGNRGYRAAQLAAGIMGGRIYLAAHALGLRATALTFYDDEVTDFFSPDAAGKAVLFLVTFGAPAEPPRPVTT